MDHVRDIMQREIEREGSALNIPCKERDGYEREREREKEPHCRCQVERERESCQRCYTVRERERDRQETP